MRGIYKRSKDVLEAAVSDRVIGLYTSEIYDVKVKAVKKIIHAFPDGAKDITINLVNHGLKILYDRIF